MVSEEQHMGGSPSLLRSPDSPSKTESAADGFLRIQGQFSPRRVLVITIGGIVLAEVIAMLIVYYFRDWPYTQQVVLDTVIMTVIIFPILYYLSFRPLLLHINQRWRAENALQESEAKFRTFADWTYDWEEWLDPKGEIIYTSPSCERITGYTPAELIADSNLLVRMIHPDEINTFKEHTQIIHEETAGPTTLEYRLIARDGGEHWIEHICRPVFGPQGRYLGRRVNNRDVTQRKLYEKRIFEQSQKEKILTQTIQTIQSGIARDLHDTLGQNISYLSMSLEYLSESGWSESAVNKDQVQNMTRVANESYELIRAMLAILQTGNTADPLILFTNYAEQIALRSMFQIDITNHGPTNQLSPHQIRQLFYIFREALSNIEKYSGATHVSGEFLWDEQSLTLVVSDNGCGFDPAAVQAKDHYGLKFMRERVELMNGSFLLQSEPGKGTTIRVVAPIENFPSS